MEKKKKTWLIVIGVILAVLALILLLLYFGVNMLFSVASNSFYQSSIVITESGGVVPGAMPGEGNAPDGQVSSEGATSGSSGNATQQPAGAASAPGDRVIPFDRLNLTMEEFKALQQQVPFSDKVAALSILSAGLSASDYTELFSMLSGGVTSDEVRRAYKIVSRGLSSEDKEKIWGYYDKYKHLIQ